MSIIKASSFALSAAAAVLLASGAANAMTPKHKSHATAQQTRTHTVRSTVEDLSAPKASLPAKEFFWRQQHDGH